MDVKHFVAVNPRIRTLNEIYKLTTSDLRELTGIADARFRAAEIQLFAGEGAPPAGQRKWKKLSPKYAKAKGRKFPGRKIMQRSGRGRKSLTTKGSGHRAFFINRPYNAIYLGTSVKHLAYHIKPTKTRPNPLYNPRLPNRDTLALNRVTIGKISAVILAWFTERKLLPNTRALAAAAAYARAKYGR